MKGLIDGEDFLIMKEEEVLGVISGAAKKETVGAKKVSSDVGGAPMVLTAHDSHTL
jgi:hypothetical protein